MTTMKISGSDSNRSTSFGIRYRIFLLGFQKEGTQDLKAHTTAQLVLITITEEIALKNILMPA